YESPDAALIHQYTFAGPGVTDSVGSVNGVLVNGATVSGGLLNLSGSAYVQFNSNIIPTGLAPFSVLFNAQELSFPSSFNDGYAEMISQGFSGGPGFYIGHDPSHNFRFGDLFMSTGIAFPNDHAMHRYALTSDASGSRFYIDGLLVGSSPTQEFIPSTGTITRLGQQFECCGPGSLPFPEAFQGAISNVRIYNTALPAAQIQ
ncbi:MAG: LamG domain-containing protein, partial [Betaproteobacteria bacterium]